MVTSKTVNQQLYPLDVQFLFIRLTIKYMRNVDICSYGQLFVLIGFSFGSSDVHHIQQKDSGNQ